MNGKEVSAALNASLLLDGEDRILEGNRDAEVFLEGPLEEVRKTPLSQANPTLYHSLKDMLAKTRRGRGIEDYALAYKIGKRMMRLSVSITPYPLEALGTTGTLVAIGTMGARPAAEKRGPRAEEQTALAVEDVPGEVPALLNGLADPAFVLDLDANLTYVNPAMSDLMGHAVEDITGRPLSFFMQREEARKSLDRLVEAASSAPWRGELEFNRGDGTTSFIAVTVDAMRAGRGRVEGLLGLGRDYTAEARLRREREDEVKRVWSLLERAGLALACITPDFRVTLLSHAAEGLLGTTSDRAIGALLTELFPPGAREGLTEILRRSLQEEVKGAEVCVKGKKGTERTFSLDIRPAVVTTSGPREYMVVLREATEELSEREKADTLLRESRMRIALLEIALHGRDSAAFLAECLDLLCNEFGCRVAAAFLVEKRNARLEAQRELGEEALELLRVLRLRPGYARLCADIDKLSIEIHGGVPKQGWREFHSLVDKADALLPLLREERWRSLLVLPLREDGMAGALAFADCDPDKMQRYDDRHLAVISRSAASVLRMVAALEGESGAEAEAGDEEAAEAEAGEEGGTPGTGGPGGAETLQAGGKRGRERDRAASGEHDYLETALEARKGEAALEELALWGDRDGLKPTPSPHGIGLAALLRELKEYYTGRDRRSEIFLEIEEDLPEVHTDRLLLRESLMVLLDNALRYSPQGAPVILGAERWGDEVLLRVEDQGPGIPPEVLEEVMRKGSEGSSGLFLCRRYVAAIGGDLSFKGKPDEGTTAFVRLRVLPLAGEGL